jgi:glycosyltransferase involved in cell wall biosynthesis
MTPISVVLITLNEERNLARCLQSVKRIANEIIVVDSMSTDNTVAIAESFGARVIQQHFTNYVEQKKIATAYAAHEWVLSIDADEALSPELEDSIQKFKILSTTFNAYKISRITNYCGQWIKHSGWYPDRITRLFDKTQGAWHGGSVHEHWELSEKSEKTGLLKGELLHYSFNSIADHVKKLDKYTELGARDAVERGKDCSLLKLVVGPRWNFFQAFILQLGILDGYYGYVICKLHEYSSFVKYSKTRQYARMKRNGLHY